MAAIISIFTLIALIWVTNHSFYLASLSRCSPVNLSTPTFGNINLTETVTNLLVVWKVKNECNNLYFHSKSFKKTNLKPKSYLVSVFRCSPEIPSTSTLPNINLTKVSKNLLVASKIIKNGCRNLCLHPKLFQARFPLWL